MSLVNIDDTGVLLRRHDGIASLDLLGAGQSEAEQWVDTCNQM
ncbi:hypothetical protein GALL_97170 [mine drainage metagenome]|uniref:Uncharacterized protein n=1 Tax=mine drainage metagenome TaxID=410659 RepID=A0A1J5SW08_9ZZZZ